MRNEDFAECYSSDRGRPSIPPWLLARALLREYRTGCSDEQAMEAIAWDLRWKIALGLAVDHRGFHPTTVTRFRARLLLHGKERLGLETALVLAEQLGLRAVQQAEQPDERLVGVAVAARPAAQRRRLLGGLECSNRAGDLTPASAGRK